jgi:hypothetical protein
MNLKLKKIAINLSELVTSYKTHQDIYNELRNIFIRNSDYFSNFKGMDLLKLTFYVKSYLEHGNVERGEMVYNNTFISGLFYLHNTKYESECEDCSGDGRVECGECYSNGVIECEGCYGSGEDYDGNSCSYCQGGGEIRCEDCDGKGYVECGECYGDGWIETSDDMFTLINIISWSEPFNIKCMDAVNNSDVEITFNDVEALKDKDLIIVLKEEDGHYDFDGKVSIDTYHCIGTTDNYMGLSPSYDFKLYEFHTDDVSNYI